MRQALFLTAALSISDLVQKAHSRDGGQIRRFHRTTRKRNFPADAACVRAFGMVGGETWTALG